MATYSNRGNLLRYFVDNNPAYITEDLESCKDYASYHCKKLGKLTIWEIESYRGVVSKKPILSFERKQRGEIMGSYSVKKVLMERDGLSGEEADETIEEMREMVLAGDDPEEVLRDMVGLEPDYMFDILDL